MALRKAAWGEKKSGEGLMSSPSAWSFSKRSAAGLLRFTVPFWSSQKSVTPALANLTSGCCRGSLAFTKTGFCTLLRV